MGEAPLLLSREGRRGLHASCWGEGARDARARERRRRCGGEGEASPLREERRGAVVGKRGAAVRGEGEEGHCSSLRERRERSMRERDWMETLTPIFI